VDWEPHFRRPISRRIFELLYHGGGCKACFYKELQAASPSTRAKYGMGESSGREPNHRRKSGTVLWSHTCSEQGEEVVDRAWIKPMFDNIQTFSEKQLKME